MKIRRLDIFGFKSFMDRTRLRFDDGITGIVGPNGCGKSNVVDAIRWVMGEQSSRVLRGKVMEDIIFAGSESKPQMGMAEVEITFENDGRNVPPEYLGLKDIAVGRRLYRSGESEYLINRTPCRLLDVQELFMGTGVGTRAYSIIGQGQIGLLVSQKPSERRILIEEAAGISKYKARKRVAERKMEQTKQNLIRVADVVQEIRRNMGSLQRQARKAARYNKLRDRLREIELHASAHRYLELHSVLTHLRRKHRDLQVQESELLSSVAKMDSQVEKDRLQLLDEDRSINQLQEVLSATDNQIKLCEQNIEFMTREVSTLAQRSGQSAEEIESLRSQLSNLAKEVEDADKTLLDLSELAKNAKFRQLEQDEMVSDQTEVVQKLEAEVDQELQHQMRGREQSVELRAKLSNLDQRLLEHKGRLGQTEAEHQTLLEQRTQLHKQQEEATKKLEQSQKTLAQLQDRRSFEENQLTELHAMSATTEARAMALREEIGNRRSRLESLLEIERNYEGCLSGVRKVMQTAEESGNNNEIVGLVADILRSPPQYETAVQAVLGDRLQSIVVRSQDTGLQAVDTLKREAEGRSSFIPLTLRDVQTQNPSVAGPGVIGTMTQLIAFDSDYASIVDYLLGDVVVVEKLEHALSIWTANGNNATLVTLDGEVLEPQGVLTGGSLEGPGTHLLQNKREIRELEEKLAGLEAQNLLVRDKQGKLKAQIEDLQASIERLKQECHAQDIQTLDQQKDLSHSGQMLSSLSANLDNLDAQRGRLASALEQIEAEKSEAQRLLKRLDADMADREAAVRSSRDELERQKRKLTGLQQDLTDLRVNAAATEERNESAQKNREHLLTTQKDLNKRIERLQLDISQGNVKSVDGKRQIEENRQEVSLHLQNREKQKDDLGTRREAYETLLAKVQEQEMMLKQNRSRQDQVVTARSEAGTQIRENEVNLDHLVQDVYKSHRLAFGGLFIRISPGTSAG